MFEWDEQKNRINLQKHGLAFDDIVGVFSTDDCLVLEDKRKSYGEVRFILIAPFKGTYVHVTFTRRAGSIRLISARRASKRERQAYEQRGADKGYRH